MSLVSLLSSTVTIIAPVAVEDFYGSTTFDYEAGTRTQVPAWVEQIGTSEDSEGRDQSTHRVRIWLPARTNAAAHDRIEVGTETYEVDGAAVTHTNPRTNSDRLSVVEAVEVRG